MRKSWKNLAYIINYRKNLVNTHPCYVIKFRLMMRDGTPIKGMNYDIEHYASKVISEDFNQMSVLDEAFKYWIEYFMENLNLKEPVSATEHI